MSEEVRLGTLLRVRGKIVMYRGAIQIAVRDVVLEKDPNAEVVHWLECVRLAKECYDLTPPSAQGLFASALRGLMQRHLVVRFYTWDQAISICPKMVKLHLKEYNQQHCGF
ncbi:hypothetical protein BAE44_0002632 [Dichanthelium oligosanthes]|uniref:CST complex subunit STN1 n=1 Tax=Dichanthelium oligosanthes TaxID=888268 RepID=A0A1E5WG46_9POAL|nr:hypothetical protein BAE44_0002632 [Dichanthelium oligosanthes]